MVSPRSSIATSAAIFLARPRVRLDGGAKVVGDGGFGRAADGA